MTARSVHAVAAPDKHGPWRVFARRLVAERGRCWACGRSGLPLHARHIVEPDGTALTDGVVLHPRLCVAECAHCGSLASPGRRSYSPRPSLPLVSSRLAADSPRFSHAQVVELACRWLASMGAHVILPESAVRELDESPDVIAWRGPESTVVEVKVTRKDASHDRGKVHRQAPGLGMGMRRWMFVPAGLLDVGELPDGWGLVEVGEGGAVEVVRESAVFVEHAAAAELALLVAAFRRVQFPRRRYPARHWVPGAGFVEADDVEAGGVEP